MVARLLLSTFAVLLLYATPVSCQESTSAPFDGAPRRDRVAVAAHLGMSDGVSPFPARQQASRPVALMIVGGAAVVLGSIFLDRNAIGVLVVLGGVVVFLYGLYLFLQ